MPAFRTGAEVARQSAERKTFVRAIDWLTLADGESVPLRFVTDEDQWITVGMHNGVPTRPAPPGFTGKWPAVMSAVCRDNMVVDDNTGQKVKLFPEHTDCFICLHLKDPRNPNKPFPHPDRTWGIAIVREEVLGPDGRITGLKDAEVEITVTENGVETKKVVPKLVKIANSYKNFWSNLVGVSSMRGTVVDIDYRCTRMGKDIDTEYGFAPYQEMNAYVPGTNEVAKFDLRDPRFREAYDIPDLGQMVTEQASDDHYDTFFDTRHPQPTRKTNSDAQPSQVPPSTNDVTEEQLASMAQRVMGTTGAAPAPAAPAAVAPAQPQAVGFIPS